MRKISFQEQQSKNRKRYKYAVQMALKDKKQYVDNDEYFDYGEYNTFRCFYNCSISIGIYAHYNHFGFSVVGMYENYRVGNIYAILENIGSGFRSMNNISSMYASVCKKYNKALLDKAFTNSVHVQNMLNILLSSEIVESGNDADNADDDSLFILKSALADNLLLSDEKTKAVLNPKIEDYQMGTKSGELQSLMYALKAFDNEGYYAKKIYPDDELIEPGHPMHTRFY
ncbi:MAG: hypothetical protein AAF378_14435 [Cyanobacteria bacterium P01_A01_bin.84]